MAEREKAIADGFDHPKLAGGVLEPPKGLWFGSQELDWEKLVVYTLWGSLGRENRYKNRYNCPAASKTP